MSKKVLVVDWLDTYGGAERVIRYLSHAFNFNTCYTLINTMKQEDLNKIFPENNVSIIQTPIRIFGKKFRYFFMLFPWAMGRIKVDKNADIIISSSHAVAKGIRKSRNDQIHICYFQARNMKYIWDQDKIYFGRILFLIRPIINVMRRRDVKDAQIPDYIISNSKFVRDWVKETYNRETTVIYPPADLSKFQLNKKKEDYFVAVGRIELYKRFDIIIDAFIKTDRKLVLIGDGNQLKKLKQRALGRNNIKFTGRVEADEVYEYIRKAKGFIHAGIEDFGIAPIEAQASGTPVIAYVQGGLSETVIENRTGVFFRRHNAESLLEAIERFEAITFDYNEVRKNAERFSINNFEEQFKSFVEKVVELKNNK